VPELLSERQWSNVPQIYRNQTCLTTKPRDCSRRLPTRLTRREPAPVQHVNLTEFENLKKELETAKAQTAELVNLKQELETLKAEKATAEKDTKWNAMKANLPEGWLGAKEPETRKEFEADPGAFALKVVAFKEHAAGRSSRPRALARPEVPETRKAPRNRSLQTWPQRSRRRPGSSLCEVRKTWHTKQESSSPAPGAESHSKRRYCKGRRCHDHPGRTIYRSGLC